MLNIRHSAQRSTGRRSGIYIGVSHDVGKHDAGVFDNLRHRHLKILARFRAVWAHGQTFEWNVECVVLLANHVRAGVKFVVLVGNGNDFPEKLRDQNSAVFFIVGPEKRPGEDGGLNVLLVRVLKQEILSTLIEAPILRRTIRPLEGFVICLLGDADVAPDRIQSPNEMTSVEIIFRRHRFVPIELVTVLQLFWHTRVVVPHVIPPLQIGPSGADEYQRKLLRSGSASSPYFTNLLQGDSFGLCIRMLNDRCVLANLRLAGSSIEPQEAKVRDWRGAVFTAFGNRNDRIVERFLWARDKAVLRREPEACRALETPFGIKLVAELYCCFQRILGGADDMIVG